MLLLSKAMIMRRCTVLRAEEYHQAQRQDYWRILPPAASECRRRLCAFRRIARPSSSQAAATSSRRRCRGLRRGRGGRASGRSSLGRAGGGSRACGRGRLVLLVRRRLLVLRVGGVGLVGRRLLVGVLLVGVLLVAGGGRVVGRAGGRVVGRAGGGGGVGGSGGRRRRFCPRCRGSGRRGPGSAASSSRGRRSAGGGGRGRGTRRHSAAGGRQALRGGRQCCRG